MKHEIIELLKQLPVYNPNSTNTQHVIRCKYCGDSYNENHGHFSIKIDEETDEPIVFRCFKCDVSGFLTSTVLEEIGLNVSNELRGNLKSFTKKMVKKNKFIDHTENFIVPIFQNTLLNYKKLEYINSRLCTEFDFYKAQEMKIILDLNTFLNINKMSEIPNVSSRYLYLLNNNYVGFLSTNNNCITLRRINDNNKLNRYVKIILNSKNINSNTFFSIPNTISLMYTHDINIRITEGIFDILSVYNMNKHIKKDNYYFASCGFGYITILKYLIYNGINTGLNIHIYSDNDKRDADHLKYIFTNTSVSCWLDRIFLHRNKFEGEKDYGVPLSRVIDSQFRIK